LRPHHSEYRDHTDLLIKAVLEAADPYRIVSEALQFRPDGLTIQDQYVDIAPECKLILIAVGKAATPMAKAAIDKISIQPEAIIVTRPEADQSPLPVSCQVFQAGHPLPNAGSLAAGQVVQTTLQKLQPGDLVILLLSGGGSALLEVPKPGLTLDDLRTVNSDLLRSGAPIEEINVIRKSMSLIKAGGLARMAAPARVIALILSDVVGDDLAVIASGPTVLEDVDVSRAREILESYGLWQRYPARIRDAFLSKRRVLEVVYPPENFLLANNQTVRSAAAEAAKRLGFTIHVRDDPLQGEAQEAGANFARFMLEIVAANPDDDLCLIQGGETTVTVRGDGKGGRNQEFCIGAANQLMGKEQIAIFSFATDGVDGPTDAAGAVVDCGLITRAIASGLDPEKHLENNDVYPLLERLGALIRTGPTQTNLNDLAVGLSYSGN
jgi:glycerate 2-kinase